MKPPPFQYLRAQSLDEALAAFVEHGDEAAALAGGQSLVPLLNMRLARPTVLVDLNGLAELGEIREDNGTVRIGAMVRQSALERSALMRSHVPLAADCAPHIGHFVTRNRGTVGGSIAHADARAELPVALSALDGSAVALSSRGHRTLSTSELFVTHFTTSLAPDELLVETVWPAISPGWGYAFEEFAQRHGDYALGMVACAMRCDDGQVATARIAVGATGDRPHVLTDVAASLVGLAVDDELAEEAGRAAAAAVETFDDLHASAAYRRHITGLLAERAIARAWAAARSESES